MLTGKPSAYYVSDGAAGNGYALFSGKDPVLEPVSGGGIVAKSNLAAGCALWEWWWNGFQFINDYDYGRQVQVALYPAEGGSALGEAGDVYGVPSIDRNARHPSPCTAFSAQRSTSSPSEVTAAAPLEWCPEYYGGGQDHPIVYPAVRLGKTLPLNRTGPDKVNRGWPVALFQTVINSPAIPRATVEAPTGYLNSTFNTYYHYDPAARDAHPGFTRRDTGNYRSRPWVQPEATGRPEGGHSGRRRGQHGNRNGHLHQRSE